MKLYKKNSNTGKTPLEDFTTEIFVGLLEDNDDMLNRFANELLGIDGEDFTIESQIRFELPNDIDCIIDIVIENEDTMCFIENKVNSSEGERQLERYTKALNNIKNKKNVYLRYCTKYFDQKKINNVNFKQFRWFDVYELLEKYKDNELVADYMEFLRSEGMSKVEGFKLEDLLVLNNVMQTFSKIDECFNKIKPYFERNFGKWSETQFGSHEAMWKYKNNVFGKDESELYLGFMYTSDEKNKTIPCLAVGVSCGKNNNRYEIFDKYIQVNHFYNDISKNNGKVEVYFQEPLSNFLNKENQFEDIENWFIGKLEKIKEFKSNTVDLDWQI